MENTVTKKSIHNFYLDYVNNFITVEKMADYYEMSIEDCRYLIDLGRKIHNKEI